MRGINSGVDTRKSSGKVDDQNNNTNQTAVYENGMNYISLSKILDPTLHKEDHRIRMHMHVHKSAEIHTQGVLPAPSRFTRVYFDAALDIQVSLHTSNKHVCSTVQQAAVATGGTPWFSLHTYVRVGQANGCMLSDSLGHYADMSL